MIYTIENEFLKAQIAQLGATLCRLIDKESGIDLVLGFDDEDGYRKNPGPNLGATIGRNANRIGEAKFSLGGKTYQLSVNDNMNQLHGGGVNGFAFKTWEVKEVRPDSITLSYFSRDGEEGFPGNLTTQVTYRLDKDSLIFSFSGQSDADTLFNITNHSYFTLGEEDILNDELYISTDRYAPVDEYSLTKDEVREVKDTPYDFTSFTKLGTNISKLERGIDNNYVWEDFGDKLMASFRNEKLQLNVYSDLPDMHVYTAYYLGGEQGKYGKTYKPYDGLALECQYFPNGINYGEKYLLPILRKGETMSHYIRYEIKTAGKE